MNEEIERVVLGLVTNAKLDSYDKDLIRRIIIGQQKEIEQYKKALKEILEITKFTPELEVYTDIVEKALKE